MQAGACAELTSGLMEGLSQLGEASYAWNADVEVPGTAPGRQEHSDVRDLRQIAGQLVHVAGSGAWRTACHPRPYDQAEHGGTTTASRPSARTSAHRRDQRLVTRRAI